jgi:hypothetical protein
MTMRRWVDWINVMFGLWLITSPWFLTMAGDDKPAAWSSWIVGVGIVSLAFFAMYKPAIWGDTIGVILGAWLLASPWVLGFAGAPGAAMNAVIIGVLVMGYALWAMRIDMTFDDGGLVSSRENIKAATRVTRAVKAVTSVKNDMQLK